MPSEATKKTASALKNYAAILGGSLLLLVALAVRLSRPEICSYPYRDDRQLTISHQVKLEQVSSSRDLDQGLSGRPCISNDQGMLFVFDQPGDYKFWMKDMKFAIDIVWLDQAKKVVHIESDVQPASYPKNYTAGQPAKYVIELAAGQAHSLQIANNQTLQF